MTETWQERLIRVHHVELEAWWDEQVRLDADLQPPLVNAATSEPPAVAGGPNGGARMGWARDEGSTAQEDAQPSTGLHNYEPQGDA